MLPTTEKKSLKMFTSDSIAVGKFRRPKGKGGVRRGARTPATRALVGPRSARGYDAALPPRFNLHCGLHGPIAIKAGWADWGKKGPG